MKKYHFQLHQQDRPWSETPKIEVEYATWEQVVIAAYTWAMMNEAEVRVTCPPYDQGHYYHPSLAKSYLENQPKPTSHASR